MHALLSTRQGALAFDQPLSLDTSSVTRMDHMFSVCSARALYASPAFKSGPPHAHRLRRYRPHALAPASHSAPRPASYALHLTWQRAIAFNQPLSFDTFSVTDMLDMFYVRSARALAPHMP